MLRLPITASLAAVLMLTASHAFAMTIYVSNEKDNTITVLDGDTLEIKKTIKVARRPGSDIDQTLERCGWRWSNSIESWYHRDTPDNVEFARGFCAKLRSAKPR